MKVIKIVARILLSAIAYIVGIVVTGMLAPTLHFPVLKPIAGTNPQQLFFATMLATPLLIIGLLPLAAGLKGNWPQRTFAIAGLIYVTLGLNTMIELKIFSNMLDGSLLAASLYWILPSLLTGAVLTFRSGEPKTAESALGTFNATGWAWRICLAWLCFPVIYFAFGMCVGPFVVPYYNAGLLGLRIPGFPVIILTQLLRSAIFLAASFPLILLWTKSRGRLIFALGLAHAMTVGVFQLAQATFFPMVMRVGHSLEITADSFAYAAVLALLFARSAKAAQPVAINRSAAAD